MTDIIKKADKIESAKTQMLSSSLKDRVKFLKSNMRHVLLIDVSGSMDEYVNDEQTKHSIMQGIVNKLPMGIRKYAFSGRCRKIEDNQIPSPSGGTDMADAFYHLKDNNIQEIILITDGMPDSIKDALRAAQGMKIDIIYIGPAPRPQFLEDLAKGSNGNFVNVDMLAAGSAGELEEKIQKLLNA